MPYLKIPIQNIQKYRPFSMNQTYQGVELVWLSNPSKLARKGKAKDEVLCPSC